MTQKVSQGFNFKIYNKETGKYFSKSYNSKAVWMKEYAVKEFIKELVSRFYKLENIEVHVFPIDTAIVVDAETFLKNDKKFNKTESEESFKINETEKFLDWLVELDIQHYKTETMPDYTPSSASHFYLKRSPERFTSDEMIKIFRNKADNKLMNRWNYAVADTMRKG